MNRKSLNLVTVILLSVCTIGIPPRDVEGAQPVSVSARPDLEYLKAVNQVAPPQDPQLLFLLMGQYASANKQAEGAEFFSAWLREFEPRLNDAQKALYLSAI